jgi:glycosyltransferase involved in cell wall biosynthesis
VRVVYYTRPDTLDAALGYVEALARRAEVHVFLEISPGVGGPLAAPLTEPIASGILPADRHLATLPDAVRAMWSDVASFQLVSYPVRRRIHPAGIPVTARFVRAIGRLRPDIIHLDNAFLRMGLIAPVAPRIDVMTIHDPAPHSGEGRWQTELARRLLFGRVSRFVVHSEAMASLLAERYDIARDRVDAVHLGPYDVFRAWARPDAPGRDDRTVLFLGRLSHYKGIGVLAAAAPLVAEAIPGVRIVVAGEPAFGFAPPTSRDLPHGGRLEVHAGRVSNERMADLYARATAVACPYRDATQSGVVMTAFAFGRPVVASAVGGLPEYVRHEQTGLIVPPNEPRPLAEALIRLLRDGDLRSRLEEGVATLVHGDRSWDRAAELMLAVYDRARAAGARGSAAPT